MTVKAGWFPSSRRARYALVTKTTAFTAVDANRVRIDFGAGPNGVWFDATYTPKLTAYDTTYRIWDNPATSSLIVLDNLKDAEKDFFPVYRRFYRTVKVFPFVTDGLLEAMGFPPRPSGNYTHYPVDRMFINLLLRPLGNLALLAAFANRDTGSSVIPYYLNGAVIYYSVSDTPVTGQTELPHSRLATRSPLELIFEPEQRGKTVYFAARWQNRWGELGPWSEIVSAVIP